MLYLSNSFSLGMIPEQATIIVRSKSIEGVKSILKMRKFTSIVGHKDIAEIMSKMLETPVAFNRQSVSLTYYDDEMIVAQYIGPRLPEGTTELPEDAKIEYRMISLRKYE